MWKKDEMPDQTHESNMESTEGLQPPGDQVPTSELATIGRSIRVKGDVTGDEDLLIQGRVEGSVELKQHSVTVGTYGEVKASITARVVTIEGKVQGNLAAVEQVVLLSSASVEGDIAAPGVVLEDGARFRGSLDMGDSAKGQKKTGQVTRPEAKVTPDASSPTPGPRVLRERDERDEGKGGIEHARHNWIVIGPWKSVGSRAPIASASSRSRHRAASTELSSHRLAARLAADDFEANCFAAIRNLGGQGAPKSLNPRGPWLFTLISAKRRS